MNQDHSTNLGTGATRRQFIQASAAASALAGLGVARSAFAQTSETLKVGLIGCGGRGSGAAREALMADPNTELVAVADVFEDKAKQSLRKFEKDNNIGPRVKVDEGHIFIGFDAYKNVVDSCDVVVLAEPPAFRPSHLKYAIEQGKHVFCEKPVAVDPTGVRSVMETCEQAKAKKLNIVSGLCYRYQFAKQATMQQIHDGVVGDIVALETKYNTGGLWSNPRKDDWSDVEYQLRNWLYYCWLSGDHINEQHIHSLDKIAWAMGDQYPVKCVSSGGRACRTAPIYGNIYDHFNTTYEFANGVKCFSSCRQWESTSTNVSDQVFGTAGTAYIQDHRVVDRAGAEKWAYKGEGEDNMYLNEHVALFKAIRAGEPINNGHYMCCSTMMAIMARMSAYTGKELTWDEALNSKLDLWPGNLEFGPKEVDALPVPGETKFI